MLPALGSVAPPCGAMLPVICSTRTPDSASQALTCFSSAETSLSSPLKILICCIARNVCGRHRGSMTFWGRSGKEFLPDHQLMDLPQSRNASRLVPVYPVPGPEARNVQQSLPEFVEATGEGGLRHSQFSTNTAPLMDRNCSKAFIVLIVSRDVDRLIVGMMVR
jgi:hypothetical protein